MRLHTKPAIGLILALTFCPSAEAADRIATDANIVTGLDISDSVSVAAMQLEIGAMADAITSPEVLNAIRSGRHRRIGFALFAWHHRSLPEDVAWTVIASAADAEAVAGLLRRRLATNVDTEAYVSGLAEFHKRRQPGQPDDYGPIGFYASRLTNLSDAIDHGAKLLATAPFAASRDVINIIGEGRDNVGNDAAQARDRAVDAGLTINGMVIVNDEAKLAYYKAEVIGGPSAFALYVRDSSNMVEAMKRKFIGDIVVSAAH
jgi:hypothetical protein